jgi:hypothetical protein
MNDNRKQSTSKASTQRAGRRPAGYRDLLPRHRRGLLSMQVFTGPEAEQLNRYLLVSAGFIILGIAVYAIMEPDRVRRFLYRSPWQQCPGDGDCLSGILIVKYSRLPKPRPDC